MKPEAVTPTKGSRYSFRWNEKLGCFQILAGREGNRVAIASAKTEAEARKGIRIIESAWELR